MGFRTFDFKCTNENCAIVGVKEERFIRYDSLIPDDLDIKCEQQLCESCGSTLQKCVSAPPTHISWSLWRAGMG